MNTDTKRGLAFGQKATIIHNNNNNNMFESLH